MIALHPFHRAPRRRIFALSALALGSCLFLTTACGHGNSFRNEATTPPAVASVSPDNGFPGATGIVITGTGFKGAGQVLFGPTRALQFTVDSDSKITATIPEAAPPGAVAVTVQKGSMSGSSQASFTIKPLPLPAAPVITGITPAQGIPGTEVTVTGTGFTGVTGVTYGGLALDAARYDLDSPTGLRVRIPDDAQAGGAIEVTTATPPSGASQDFVLLPSRRSILPQPLVLSTHGFDQPYMDFPAKRRSAIYEDFHLPLSPVFHAYHPSEDSGIRAGKTAPSYTLSLKLPSPFLEALPQSLKDRIRDLGIPTANVDILVSSQDYMYDGVTANTGVYLFRPHYWTDPDAPNSGIYNKTHTLSGGIFEAGPGITISGHASGEWFDFSIVTHSSGGSTPSLLVASANSEPMAGFDTNVSTGFYSLVQNGDRAAVTLHLLLDDASQDALNAIAANPSTVGTLFSALQTSIFGTSRGIQLLVALARPAITTVTQAPSDGGANVHLTLTGSGFEGATAVLLNGTPLAIQGTGNSDAILRVVIPAGATGTLQVESPLGTSDAVTLSAS